MNLSEISKLDETKAREYFESLRWPNGPVCPHCQSDRITRLEGDAHRAGTIQCNECRQQFTVTVGTVMEDTHIPLSKWAMAFHLLCSSKKGMSAKQIQRNLGLGSYKTAWFMCHRIRYAMANGPMKDLLKGTVEADETYIGGKPRSGGPKRKRGRGTSKAPVTALVERDGNIRVQPVECVDGETLRGEIKKHVDPAAIIMTDEFASYRGLDKDFAGHETVNHSAKQYVRYTPDTVVHTNTAESFFALMKRGHYGVYHSMSKRHLHRYCSEFEFRWDNRKTTDGERTDAAIRKVEGKRLYYHQPDRTKV